MTLRISLSRALKLTHVSTGVFPRWGRNQQAWPRWWAGPGPVPLGAGQRWVCAEPLEVRGCAFGGENRGKALRDCLGNSSRTQELWPYPLARQSSYRFMAELSVQKPKSNFMSKQIRHPNWTSSPRKAKAGIPVSWGKKKKKKKNHPPPLLL